MTETFGITEKELITARKEKLLMLKKMGANPFPSKSAKNVSAKEIIEKEKEFASSEKSVTAAGRATAIRGHGKLVFVDLADETGKIQILLKADLLGDSFDIVSAIDIGDFLEAQGKVLKTKSGEISIEAGNVRMLAKSLRSLPDKRHGLADEETKLRKRYLDFALNPELRELFKKKAKFWQSMRDFLVKEGFLEVETPALENTAGGADANPFVTHHDALDLDVYLRISMGELWQKRLMVGGFGKTFEIGRQFRNEGISREHLQDYTQMEFYWAYANYEDSMKLVERLFKHVAKETFGTLKFKIGQFNIDLDKSWEIIDYTETIKEKLEIDVLKASKEELLEKLRQLKVSVSPKESQGRLIDLLLKQIRKDIVGPVFLINHPVLVSPLAKRKEDNPLLAERYQVIIAGSELGNGYSELNDPEDQRERFIEQAKMREEGDKEAQMFDEDFVEALEYGMPPTTGFGLSERTFAFLADKSVRETVMFPLLKPESRNG